MAGRFIAAIDLGTTSCRAELFAADGSPLGRHSVEYPVLVPEPGAAEQDAEGWWDAACACLRATLREAGVGGADVAAVGLSAQGHSWVPTDERFRPLRKAFTWLDQRAGAQACALLEERGAQFWGTLAGKMPGPWHMLPQLMWLREAEPDTSRAAAHLLMAHDYLIARLTGKAVTDYTTAAATLLFDIDHLEWDPTLLHTYQVAPALLPRAAPSGTAVGHLTPEAAEATGLSTTTIAVTGAQDQKCAASGAGLAQGVATVSLGTATAIEALLPHPVFDAETPIPCFPYLTPERWVLEAAITTTGGAVNWLRDALRPVDPTFSHAHLSELAESAPPGSHGVVFFPFPAGAGTPHWRFGATAAFSGMTLAATVGDFARAVFEGCSYEVATALDAMRAAGARVDRLHVFGGGARSELWLQILAAVCGLPVYVCREAETALRGAAMLAAHGVFGSRRGAGLIAALRPDLEHVVVDTASCATYGPLMARYRRARDAYWAFDSTLNTEDKP